MLKSKPFLLTVLPLGAAGGVLRAFELRWAYDVVTGLAPRGHFLSVALLVLTAAAVAVCAALAMRGKADDSSRNLNGARLPLITAAFILGCSCVADAVDMMRYTFSIAEIVLAALGLLTAVMLILMASTITARMTGGMYAAVAVYWSGLWLLLLFSANAGNPVFGRFGYELMAVMFSAVAFYMFAGIHFGSSHPRVLTFTAGVGIFLLMTSVIGPVLARLLYGGQAMLDGVTSTGLLRLLFALLYLACMPTLAKRVRHMPDDSVSELEAGDEIEGGGDGGEGETGSESNAGD